LQAIPVAARVHPLAADFLRPKPDAKNLGIDAQNRDWRAFQGSRAAKPWLETRQSRDANQDTDCTVSRQPLNQFRTL
jgi:hypothetical protein